MSEDKINRRSANITEGVARAPNRSMYYAMGYTGSDFGKQATSSSVITWLTMPPCCRTAALTSGRAFDGAARYPAISFLSMGRSFR